MPNHACRLSALSLGCTLLVALAGLDHLGRVPPAHSAAGERIAYISPSRDNQSIRSVNPDGTDDRLVWSVPPATARENAIGRLSWRPDRAELAFDSSHDNLRSMLGRELFGVAPDGSRLRRITRPPSADTAASLPQGQVTVTVENYNLRRTLSVYVEGASAPITLDAAAGSAYDLRFTSVADYGPDVRQYVRVLRLTPIVGEPCWFDNDVYVDVRAGQTTAPPNNRPFLLTFNDFSCGYMFQSSWRADGTTLAFLYREAQQEPLLEPNNIWQIPTDAPRGSEGQRLFDASALGYGDRIYLLAHAPTAAQAGEVAFVQYFPLTSDVYRGRDSDLGAASRLNLGACPRVSCVIVGLSWLPDGSGLLLSRYESGAAAGTAAPEGGVVYRYTFANSRLTELVRLPNEAIGGVSVAPDGRTLVFERGPRLEDAADRTHNGWRVQCPCSIWVSDSSGDNLLRLAQDGRAPVWSPGAVVLPAPLRPRGWLPLALR